MKRIFAAFSVAAVMGVVVGCGSSDGGENVANTSGPNEDGTRAMSLSGPDGIESKLLDRNERELASTKWANTANATFGIPGRTGRAKVSVEGGTMCEASAGTLTHALYTSRPTSKPKVQSQGLHISTYDQNACDDDDSECQFLALWCVSCTWDSAKNDYVCGWHFWC